MNWIFFDLDDTVWDFSGNSNLALNEIYDFHEIVRTKYPVRQDFLDVYHIHNHRLWKDVDSQKITTDFLKGERWRATLFADDISQNLLEFCREIDADYLSRLAKMPNVVEDAKDVLEKLSENYLLAILSNGFNSTQYQKLYNSGLDRYINRLITSEEIGIPKPDKRLFDYAIKETGAARCSLMVGDNLKNDVLGAVKAGWKAVWYRPDFKIRKDCVYGKCSPAGTAQRNYSNIGLTEDETETLKEIESNPLYLGRIKKLKELLLLKTI